MQMMKLGFVFILMGFALNLSLSKPAQAEWDILPDSRHQQFDLFGRFFDEQTMLINYGSARLWASMGGTVPVYGNNELPSHPQITFHASANAALHYDSNFRFYTETIDARFGGDLEFAINPHWRASVGITHNSGHAADGIAAEDLSAPIFSQPLGQEFVPIKTVYDLDKSFRFAFAFKPFIRSFPALQWAAFDESIEWFPFGAKDDPHSGSPFIAIDLDQYGPYSYLTTINVQAGVYFGNHFSEKFNQTMRIVAGYYSGADPRLKYFQFLNNTQLFYYFGAMFNL